MVLGVLNVFFRDVGQAFGIIVTFWFLADADRLFSHHLAAVDAVIDGVQSIGRLHWRGSGCVGEGNMAGLEQPDLYDDMRVCTVCCRLTPVPQTLG